MNIPRKLLAAWLSSAMLLSAPGPWLSSALAANHSGAGRAVPRAVLRAAAASRSLPSSLSPAQGLSVPSAPALDAGRFKLPGTGPAAAAPEAKPDLKTTLGQAKTIAAAEGPSGQAGLLASFLDNSRLPKATGSVAADAALGVASAMALSPAAAQAANGKAASVASPSSASRPARRQSWAGATLGSALSAFRGVALKVKLLATVAVLAVVAGCGGGGGGHSSSYTTASPHYVTYAYNGHPLATLPVDSYDTAKEDELLAYINDHRYWLGLPPLTQSFSMGDIARAHSWHMADYHDFLGTYNPEGDGPSARATLVGEYFFTYDENVVAGWWVTDAYTAFNEMLNNPYQRAVMEDYWWTHAGAGYRYNFFSTDENYWTVDFKED